MSKASAIIKSNPEILAAIAVGLVGIYLASKVWNAGAKAATAVGNAVAATADKVNPASQNNVVQNIGTAVYRLGDQKRVTQDLTLSTAVVDWFNFGGVNDYDPNAPTPAPSTATRVGARW